MTAEAPLRVVAPPPLIVGGGLLVALTLDRFVPLAAGYAAPLLGLPLVAVALALAAWGVAALRRARTTVLPYGTATSLVPAGPYRRTRNPMYVGMLLAYAGLAVAAGSWWSWLFLPAVVATLHVGVVRREEAHLEARFGGDYLAYKRRVRRWL